MLIRLGIIVACMYCATITAQECQPNNNDCNSSIEAINQHTQDKQLSTSASNHKIIFLISPPRHLSVAFLRMIEARGDFTVLHEPSQFAYCNAMKNEARSWFKHDAPATFAEVKKLIMTKAQSSNVFVKDMSFAVEQFLLNDAELLNNKNIHFIFLARNPHHAIISFYKKRNLLIPGIADQTVFSHLIGYQSLYEIFAHIQQRAINKPYLIQSEDLYKNPRKTITDLCNFLDIPFKENALQWEQLDDNFEGESWHEIKPKHIMDIWHKDAIQSTQFTTPTTYKVVANGKPSFEEVECITDRTICQAVYTENLEYYNKTLELARQK